MPAIHGHFVRFSTLSINVAALTMRAQKLALKRIRQKIGRIGITARA
jgi:hypothetical protein